MQKSAPLVKSGGVGLKCFSDSSLAETHKGSHSETKWQLSCHPWLSYEMLDCGIDSRLNVSSAFGYENTQSSANMWLYH